MFIPIIVGLVGKNWHMARVQVCGSLLTTIIFLSIFMYIDDYWLAVDIRWHMIGNCHYGVDRQGYRLKESMDYGEKTGYLEEIRM